MIDIRDYITLDSYKALLIICEGMSIPVRDMIYQLKLCFVRGGGNQPSQMFYQIGINGEPDKMLFCIDSIGQYCDAQMNVIDLSTAKVDKADRKHYYKLMEKNKSEIVVLTFNDPMVYPVPDYPKGRN